MTLHTEIERSDENEGAYRTDVPITFDNITKTGTSVEDLDEQPLTEPQESSEALNITTHDTGTVDGSASQSDAISEIRQQLADAIAHRHLKYGPDKTYTSTNMDSVDGVTEKFTEFSFCRGTVDDETVYYLIHETLQPGHGVAGKVTAVTDVGINWDYRVPSIDDQRLNEAIERERHRDHRRGDDPVEYLSDDQIEAIQHEYREIAELKMSGLDIALKECIPDAYLFGRFVVLDVSEVVFRARLNNHLTSRQIDHLSSRQLDVMQDALLASVWDDLGGRECNEYGVTDASMEYPITIALSFEI